MERRSLTPPPLLLPLLLLLGLTASASAAAAAATSPELADPQLGTTDYRAEILIQVNLMDELFSNMTIELMKAIYTTPAPVTTAEPAPQAAETERQDPLELLPHGRFLSKRGARLPLLPRRLTIETDEAPLGEGQLDPCKKNDINDALVDSAAVLDRVAASEPAPDVLTDMEEQNRVLSKFFTDCSLSDMPSEDAYSVLGIVSAAETHVAAARAAVTPPEVGLEVGSAFMVVLITFSCLMAVLALVGLAVLGYRYTTVTSGSSTGPRKAGRGGGKKDAQAAARGRPNPAFQPTDPPGSLHQARNERWRGHSEGHPESPHRPPANSKSTWGRIWGGVVRDYQRARDSVAEPPRTHSPPPRRHSPPPRRHSPPPRRHSPPPRRHSPPPRRHSPPPRHHSPPPRRHSPPPLRSSPPPRRASPSPQAEGGDNWAYGPTGRNKSTDSPFASAW